MNQRRRQWQSATAGLTARLLVCAFLLVQAASSAHLPGAELHAADTDCSLCHIGGEPIAVSAAQAPVTAPLPTSDLTVVRAAAAIDQPSRYSPGPRAPPRHV